MKVIGFTSEFYTLWEVYEPKKVPVSNWEFFLVEDHVYIQNLSTDLESAKAKAAAYGPYRIDLSLRGEKGLSSFTRKSEIMDTFEGHQFTFGQLKGKDIRESSDTWQLYRAYTDEIGEAQRGFAKNRLIELGEYVEYQGYLVTVAEEAFFKKRDEINANSGHFFEMGAKVELSITLRDKFSFESMYGISFVLTFADETGRIFKYMGAAPPNISVQDKVKVRATIKHSEYKGVFETMLQRIKVI